MKNILILLLIMIPSFMVSQSMEWVLSEKIMGASCADFTSCENNLVCYKLVYTPKESGVISSYTTGFFADCQNAKTTVKINESCIMNDNSREVIACESHGKILLNCSGNSGTQMYCSVKANQKVVLHQVCFEINKQNKICIEKDKVTNLTVSLDRAQKAAITEMPEYVNHFIENTLVCDVNDYNISLKAEKNEHQQVVLSWNGNEIEKGSEYSIWKSIDGKNFKKFHSLPNKGLRQISFKDKDAVLGVNYYYIKYTVPNKNSVFSNTEHLKIEAPLLEIKVYPNPVKDFLFVKLDNSYDELEYIIYDNLGEIISSKIIMVEENNKLDLSGLIAGVYSIKFIYGELSVIKKIVVING